MCKHILIKDFQPSDLETLSQFIEKTFDNDGFGAIIRDKTNSIHTLKSLSQGDFYLKLGQALATLQVSDLVVHHRTSTNGQGINYAHPFEYQGNYLTHNGVVSVPDKHETLTTNDSEALLHHLIKTDFQTETIQGYFSCFILNKAGTIVLVDDKAPIYSNDRIFSSHKLGDDFLQVSLKKIVIPLQGEKVESTISVLKSEYGRDKAHLSIGKSYSFQDYDYSDRYYSSDYFSQVDVFLKYISADDEYLIASQRKRKRKIAMIKSIADSFSIRLSPDDIADLMDYFDSSYYRTA